MRSRALGGCLVFVLLFVGVNAAAQDVPAIYLYVNDLTTPGTLTSDEVGALEDLCYQVDRISSAEIAILVVNTTLPLGIVQFSIDTFAKNGIGKRGLDNGLLLVVSTDERAWRFEVGYGLEGTLPAPFVGRVGLDNLTPALQAGNFFDGIYNATYAVGTQIVNHYDPNAGKGFPNPLLWVLDWKNVAIVVAVFLGVAVLTRGRSFLWLGTLFSLFKRGGFGGGRSGGGGAKGRF